MTDTAPLTSYDTVPYPSVPFVQSHPDRLATLAKLFGLNPCPVAECRVLELGCAGGENLIPLALAHPQAQFHGIDLSQRHIDSAQESVRRLGVSNVHIQRMDILTFPDELEPFDYILAHGIYSWVPAPVQDKLLWICRRHLKSQGVAYVSYNVNPGWRMRSIVRDVLMYHVRNIADAQTRIDHAYAILQFLAKSIPEAILPYATVFRHVLSSFEDDDSKAARLFHDFLEPDNEPLYFHEFMARAAAHGLQFLAESDISEMQPVRFSQEVVSVLDKLGDSILEREQYLDFLKNRGFRQTLLCHEERQLDRQLRSERLAGLHVMAEITCEVPDADFATTKPYKFRRENDVEAVVDHPLTKAALWHLSQISPQSIAFEDLQIAARARLVPGRLVVQPATDYAQDTKQLADHLLHLHASGVLELHAAPPVFATQIGERPRASPWARYQIERGRSITNLRHHGVKISDIHRQLVWLMDGTRDRNQLLDDLLQHVEQKQLVVIQDGQAIQGAREIRRALDAKLNDSLQMAARLALLVG